MQICMALNAVTWVWRFILLALGASEWRKVNMIQLWSLTTSYAL